MGTTSGGGTPDVRYAEVVSCLAVAQDLCFGQPTGSQQRGALLAVGLAEAAGLDAANRATVFWTGLLRFLGCTGHAHEVAVVFGDDIATRARSFDWDPANPVELARELVTRSGTQHSGLRRVQAVLAVLAGGRSAAELNFRTGCEVAGELARRLGADAEVREALAHSFERWNGSGYPTRAKRAAIPVAARVSLVAQEFEVLARVHGIERASEVLHARAGRSYDPDVVATACTAGPALLTQLESLDTWDETLARDPDPQRCLDGTALDEALAVVADFVDLKSPFLPGHSRGVASMSQLAARSLGLTPDDVAAVRRAGLLHDLGRCAISNAVWDKPGPLTRDQRDLVQTHSLRGEQLVRRIPGLAACVTAVGHHHERADGAGYHRGVRSGELPLTARVLAAADCYQALIEPRAYRDALAPDQAAAQLRSAARSGQLDPTAADAVLAAVGAAPRRPVAPPAGLTAREVEVLVLVARGLTTQQIATRLGISPKTADSHIQHLYPKIGVSTRGAAALFAVRTGLLPVSTR